MNIPLEVLIGYGGTAVTIIGGWFAMKFGLDRANEKIQEANRQIEALWKWKEDHAHDSNEMRERFNKDISKLEGAALVANQQFNQIMSMLQDIKERIEELEKKS